VLAGAASAASEATVYMFPSRQSTENPMPPTLSPEEARLVFAQQMGVSEYHSIGSASDNAISYINKFGKSRDPLFAGLVDYKRTLVVFVDGVSSETAEPLLKALPSVPAFTISNPPSFPSNQKLVKDLNLQAGANRNCPIQDAVTPFNDDCWSGSSKIIQEDLSTAYKNTHNINTEYERLIRFADKGELDVTIILMPASSGKSKISAAPYGSYQKPSQAQLGRRQAAEAPMTIQPLRSSVPDLHVNQAKISNYSAPITGQRSSCFASLDSCTETTRSCSSRGSCIRRFGNNDGTECYACSCDVVINGTSFGGWACHKKDISASFWLIAIPSIVLAGLVAWGIGLLYSIGETPLPGVISAGVSNTKTAR